MKRNKSAGSILSNYFKLIPSNYYIRDRYIAEGSYDFVYSTHRMMEIAFQSKYRFGDNYEHEEAKYVAGDGVSKFAKISNRFVKYLLLNCNVVMVVTE